MKLSIIGPPGSGKGTMSSLIAKKYKLKEIEVGDLLRELATKNTKTGKLVKRMINKGKLVPSNIVTSLVKKQLSKYFIIDGYPREIEEAKALDEIAKLNKVILLEVSRKTIIKRLSKRLICPKCDSIYHLITKKPKKDTLCDKCKIKLVRREDDKPEAIKERLNLFKKETFTVIKYYNKKSILNRISAEGSIKNIFRRIERCLSK